VLCFPILNKISCLFIKCKLAQVRAVKGDMMVLLLLKVRSTQWSSWRLDLF
jgi:hypothetical protein